MSCKYCNIKRRKDDDAEWLAGEEWESESDDGGYICPHDDGFRMLVYYDARYACTAVDNIKYCPFCGAKLTMPAEPLIKDEKVRKAVRAWADANSILGDDRVEATTPTVDCAILTLTFGMINIDIFIDGTTTLENHGRYTIDELCGEEE